MRDKFSKIVLAATLTLALASSATSATAKTYYGPVTQIDDFANGSEVAITGEPWYNYIAKTGGGRASISNEGEVVNPAGYAELKDVSLYISSWDYWAQATIGLDTKNNGVHYNLAQCHINKGFRYKYKGNVHEFALLSSIDGKQARHYETNFSYANNWTEVTVAPSSLSKDEYAEIIMDLDLSKVSQIEWTVRPMVGETVTGYLQIKDFECLRPLYVDENVKEECESTPSSSSGGGDTPIRHTQTASGNLLIKTTANAIMLENLPSNARVEVYNLQGKRLHSTHSANNKTLKIPVQTGMYIIKINNQILRIPVI